MVIVIENQKGIEEELSVYIHIHKKRIVQKRSKKFKALHKNNIFENQHVCCARENRKSLEDEV
jgi:hypothetical protein